MALPPSSTRRKLPVWATVAACYSLVLRNISQLFRIAWFPTLAMVPAYAATYWTTWPWSEEAGGSGLIKELASALPSLIELPFLASIAVAWHRLLLRQERIEGGIYFRFDRTVWRYAALLLVLLILATATLYLTSSLPQEGEGELLSILIAIVMTLFVVPRLSIALPAIALNEATTLAEAWQLSRGNTWRLAFATMLCAIPPLVVAAPLYWLFDWRTRVSSVALGTTASLVDAIFVIFGVTLLSLAYRFFVLREDSDPVPPA